MYNIPCVIMHASCSLSSYQVMLTNILIPSHNVLQLVIFGGQDSERQAATAVRGRAIGEMLS